MFKSFGKIILFGSGETSQSGKTIFRKIFSTISRKQNIAILETPAGFQPNSREVAQEISDIFTKSLTEFVRSVRIIPARIKGTEFSPDNPYLIAPVNNSDFILLGPGSPTYAVRQLQNSILWKKIIGKWESGTTLCFSSAAALACGKYTLPVYEIYKVGQDPHWIDGLNIFQQNGIPLTIITHWNNQEGGKVLDTRFCYMGKDRFDKLLKMLPSNQSIIGIDENTAVIFDIAKSYFYLEGKGSITLVNNSKKLVFGTHKYYSIDSITKTEIIEIVKPNFKSVLVNKISKAVRSPIPVKNLPVKLQTLINERLKFKLANNFKKTDEIRNYFKSIGYEVRDMENGQEIYQIK